MLCCGVSERGAVSNLGDPHGEKKVHTESREGNACENNVCCYRKSVLASRECISRGWIMRGWVMRGCVMREGVL